LVVANWSLILGVSSQHALNADANALDVLYRAPALLSEKIQADEAVGIDVGMHGYRAIRSLLEDYLGGFCSTGQPWNCYDEVTEASKLSHTNWVAGAEHELEGVGLIIVERVVIHDLNIQQPFLEIVGAHKCDPWWQCGGLEFHELLR
jgi:hypothetical protein